MCANYLILICAITFGSIIITFVSRCHHTEYIHATDISLVLSTSLGCRISGKNNIYYEIVLYLQY